MSASPRRCTAVLLSVIGAAAALFGACRLVEAAGVPSSLRRSFAFPVSFATGVTVDLVTPAGTTSPLTFGRGIVAVGYLPIPRPMPLRPRRRTVGRQEFVRPVSAPPRARLLLSGVVNADGSAVTSSGNELVIDVLVSPTTGALSPPPFVIPFDIQNGTAFVDAPLPLAGEPDGPVRIQVLGVTVTDPTGLPFGVPGFAMSAAGLVPRPTPTPGGPAPRDGQCFVGPDCSGPSFAAPQERCCRFSRPASGHRPAVPVSWCSADQYDSTTGQCSAAACVACVPPTPLACDERPECAGACVARCADGHVEPGICTGNATCQCEAACEMPPPAPPACADAANCAGACTVTCADGTIVTGQCATGRDQQCGCSAVCREPTPCSVGQCFDTIGFRCTAEPCGPDLHCPLPNQFCDVSGRHCPCSAPPPPLPAARVCCQCKDRVPACFTLSFVEVVPICPPGCETFPEETCDPQTGSCVAPTSCATDADCDDGNGCTIDHCIEGACTHDCVCVGPVGCGPGPAHR